MQNNNQALSITPIAWVRSDYKDKFATPRQPGLVPQAKASVALVPEYQADSVSGLGEFSHIWLVFGFHATAAQGWKPKVRPPRLGGNAKLGLFATRTTFRPNPLGLSLVRLTDITTSPTVVLHIQGADIIDGTPVYDIKPYLPWAEALPEATGGFAHHKPGLNLPVVYSEAAQQGLAATHDADLPLLIENTLLQDPRPAYQDEPQRIYGCRLRQVNVQWQVHASHILVTAITYITHERL